MRTALVVYSGITVKMVVGSDFGVVLLRAGHDAGEGVHKLRQRSRSGSEGTQPGGMRYPIPVAMRSTVTMPEHYRELMGMPEGEGG